VLLPVLLSLFGPEVQVSMRRRHRSHQHQPVGGTGKDEFPHERVFRTGPVQDGVDVVQQFLRLEPVQAKGLFGNQALSHAGTEMAQHAGIVVGRRQEWSDRCDVVSFVLFGPIGKRRHEIGIVIRIGRHAGMVRHDLQQCPGAGLAVPQRPTRVGIGTIRRRCPECRHSSQS
jgi:hypothetical protein